MDYAQEVVVGHCGLPQRYLAVREMIGARVWMVDHEIVGWQWQG
jgi:hypothetical protein